jgi:Protein of unknown function (DUF2950)
MNSMTLQSFATERRSLVRFCVLAPILFAFVFGAQSVDAQQKSFPTARQAVKALVEAANADNVSALLEIFGPDGKELVSSGDDVADKSSRASFVKAYQQQHRLISAGPGKLTLLVGSSDWPVPIPIVKSANGWSFDTAAGKQEVLYRRIGQNELDAIRVCRAVIEAERDYARTGHDGNPPGVFTKKFRSDPGKQNGLYWETSEGEPESPGGPLLAEASSDGYERGPGRHQPFHGYLYRILSSQGPHTLGGARDYVVDGKMTRGFVVVAYPAEYRSSGVMTFMVNQRSIVYQKDLGENTALAAKAMTAFDPDSSWQAVH